MPITKPPTEPDADGADVGAEPGLAAVGNLVRTRTGRIGIVTETTGDGPLVAWITPEAGLYQLDLEVLA